MRGERLDGAGIVGLAGKHHVGAFARQLGAVLEQANVVGLHALQLAGEARREGGGIGKAAEAGERPAACRAPRAASGSARRRPSAGDARRCAGSGRPRPSSSRAAAVIQRRSSRRCKRRQRVRHAQLRLASAGDQLLGLHEELDLADAAAADLDVVAGHADGAEAAKGMDLALHGVDVGDGREVEVLAPDVGGEALTQEAWPAAMSPATGRALMRAARSQFWPKLS